MPLTVSGTPNAGDPRPFDFMIRGNKKIGVGPWKWVCKQLGAIASWIPEFNGDGVLIECTEHTDIYALFEWLEHPPDDTRFEVRFYLSDYGGLTSSDPAATVLMLATAVNADSSLIFQTETTLTWPDPIEFRYMPDTPLPGYDDAPYQGYLAMEPKNWSFPDFDP